MSVLTSFGTLHTMISVIAVGSGLVALIRDREISPRNRLGKTYLITTALTCLTGLAIFQHGGLGPPHVLSILTLVVLAIGLVAASTRLFGRAARYVTTVSFSVTFFFHMIPLFTESLTRLPVNAPLLASQDSPVLPKIFAACFVLLLVGVTLQVRRLRARPLRAEGDTQLAL